MLWRQCQWVLMTMATLLRVDLSVQEVAGGRCFLEGNYDSEEVAKNYQREFPLLTSPSVQGVHLVLNGSHQMGVIWLNPTKWSAETDFTPTCFYGVNRTSLTYKTLGHAYSYPDGDFTLTLNMANLNLTSVPSATGLYYYRCGDPQFGWSEVFSFTLQPTSIGSGTKRRGHAGTSGRKIALVGDWGVTHGEHTLASITKRVDTGEVQLLVHEGDISYANRYSPGVFNNSYVWVAYMNFLQPMASRIPYMVCPGNHDSQFSFAAYLNWLKTPNEQSGSTSAFWYSFDYMGVHFVSFSTEHDFTPNSTQHRWIEQDLKRANQNRDTVPWIIVFGHRPLYCTSLACAFRCTNEAPAYRARLEDLFHEQHVDVYLSGHNHQYERTFPVYRANKTQDHYKDPTATVYIVNGAAGCPELNDPTFRLHEDWRAFAEPTFYTGYVLLEPSEKELKFQYVLSFWHRVIDTFTITRT